jgi:hypothetical protein
MTQEEKNFFIETFKMWDEVYKPKPYYTLNDVEKCSGVVSEKPFDCFVFVPKNGQIIFTTFYGHYENGGFYSAHVTDGLFSHLTLEMNAKYFVRFRSDDFGKNQEEKEEKKHDTDNIIGESKGTQPTTKIETKTPVTNNTVEKISQKAEPKGVAQSGGFFNYTNFSNVQENDVEKSYLLSLRNKAAIGAMQSLIKVHACVPNNVQLIAKESVKYADALLEELTKNKN